MMLVCELFCSPFTFCDVEPGQSCDPSGFNYWYFLDEGNCTYVGTKEFEGVKVDVWDCVDVVSGLHNYRRYYGCSRGGGG